MSSLPGTQNINLINDEKVIESTSKIKKIKYECN